MLIRLVFAVVLILILTGTALAQAPTDQDHDVIVLKSGGVARGKIVETVEGSHLVLEVANGKRIKIQLDDIHQVTNNKVYMPPPAIRRGSESFVDRPRGARFLSHAMVISGEHSTNYGASLQLGGFVESNAMLTVGLQLDWYAINVLSVRLNAYVFSKDIPADLSDFNFFLHGGVGYGQVVNGLPRDTEAGGVNISGGVGFMLPSQIGSAFVLEFGLHHQSISTKNGRSDEGNFTTLSLGLWF